MLHKFFCGGFIKRSLAGLQLYTFLKFCLKWHAKVNTTDNFLWYQIRYQHSFSIPKPKHLKLLQLFSEIGNSQLCRIGSAAQLLGERLCENLFKYFSAWSIWQQPDGEDSCRQSLSFHHAYTIKMCHPKITLNGSFHHSPAVAVVNDTQNMSYCSAEVTLKSTSVADKMSHLAEKRCTACEFFAHKGPCIASHPKTFAAARP